MAFNIFCRAALLDEEIVVYGDGHQTRDFTFVSDVVQATRAASVSGIDSGGAYNVGGGMRASLREVLGTFEDLVGRPLRITYAGEQAGDVRDTGADTSKAREHLSFSPQIPLNDGLAAEFEWIKGLVESNRVL